MVYETINMKSNLHPYINQMYLFSLSFSLSRFINTAAMACGVMVASPGLEREMLRTMGEGPWPAFKGKGEGGRLSVDE